MKLQTFIDGLFRADFQYKVARWMTECFSYEITDDKVERNHRFFEEATELVQSLGMSKEECLQLIDYVYGRPIGEPEQEVGGVMVTLAGLCTASRIKMYRAAWKEHARISEPEIMEKIRTKQAAKPKFGPLPGPSEQAGLSESEKAA